MSYFLPLIGIIGSVFLLKYREKVGEVLGEAAWMQKIGGVYNVVIIIAIFIFFWSIAALTGTTDILFRPLLYLIPGLQPAEQPGNGFMIE